MEEIKKCYVCKRDLPFTEFHKSKSHKSGCINKCKSCVSEYAKEWWKENGKKREQSERRKYDIESRRYRNKKYVYDYLTTHPCVDCGETRIPTLQFDHVRGEKKYNISHLTHRTWSLEVLKDEMAKCDVRCANCHACKTAIDFNWYNGLEEEKPIISRR